MTPTAILNEITSNGMRGLTEARAIQAMEEYSASKDREMRQLKITNSELSDSYGLLAVKWNNLNAKMKYIESEVEILDKARELFEWLDSECPQGTNTHDLSHDFAELLRERLDKLKL